MSIIKPKILYKYRALSPLTEQIIENKQVWLSKLEDLNDPFEGSVANYSMQIRKQMIHHYRHMQIMSFVVKGDMAHQQGRPFFGLKGRILKSYLKRFKTKSLDRQYNMMNLLVSQNHGINFSRPEELLRSFDDRLKNVGVFSMSENSTNQLMWAHYADESRGLALGFSVEEGNRLSDDNHCLPITYSDIVPTFKPEDLNCHWQFSNEDGKMKIGVEVPFDDSLFKKIVLTKSKAWQYECEWRYFEESSGLHDYPGKLQEVIFGLRCPENEKKKYKRLVENKFDYPIKFYQIKKMRDSSQFEKELMV